MKTIKYDNKAEMGIQLSPSKPIKIGPNKKAVKSTLTKYIVVKAFCGIKEGSELLLNPNSANTKYMVDKGYVKVK